MCEPLTATQMFAISLGLTAATTAVSVAGQQQAANAQEAYQKSVYEAEKASAEEAYRNQILSDNLRLAQEDEAKSQDLTENVIRAAEARSTARVAAGEAGVAGLSVDALMHDFSRSEAVYKDAVNRNHEFRQLQSVQDRKSYDATRRSRIHRATPQPVQKPSYLGAALRIGGGAFDSYTKFASRDPETGKYSL